MASSGLLHWAPNSTYHCTTTSTTLCTKVVPTLCTPSHLGANQPLISMPTLCVLAVCVQCVIVIGQSDHPLSVVVCGSACSFCHVRSACAHHNIGRSREGALCCFWTPQAAYWLCCELHSCADTSSLCTPRSRGYCACSSQVGCGCVAGCMPAPSCSIFHHGIGGPPL